MSDSDQSASPPAAVASHSRRSVLLAVGAGAALAGLGLALWHRERIAQPAAEPFAGFWAHQWTATDGKMLPMSSFIGKPLLINFWASWCAPCVEELPMVDAFYTSHHKSGWQVLGLAADKPQNVQQFLQKTPLHFPVAVDAMLATQWARQLGNVSGGLPFSVVLNSVGEVAQRKMGKLSQPDLDAWASLK
ncbi:MAG: TlpA family protein disulfide reductase [Betaproteobacteria bacterium]|jgi:thiol-disulfide isomerase/thioredoxin|nr:TlpA family protein disulfide reductase [Betaproteobacteria bacterium]